MAERLDPKELVTLTQQEVLEEIDRMKRGATVPDESVTPLESFETWLLQRVAQAVEEGEVSADLVLELRNAITDAQDRSPGEGHAVAVQDVADRLGISADQAAQSLENLERLPLATREAFLRRVADMWLTEQAALYRRRQDA
jgi:hypothetical protein